MKVKLEITMENGFRELRKSGKEKLFFVDYESQADLKIFSWITKVRLAGKTVLKNSSCIKALG